MYTTQIIYHIAWWNSFKWAFVSENQFWHSRRDTVGKVSRRAFGPEPFVFMFTALTPQWRVDKLITQQSSQANTSGVEMSQQSKLCERQLGLLKIIHFSPMFFYFIQHFQNETSSKIGLKNPHAIFVFKLCAYTSAEHLQSCSHLY